MRSISVILSEYNVKPANYPAEDRLPLLWELAAHCAGDPELAELLFHCLRKADECVFKNYCTIIARETGRVAQRDLEAECVELLRQGRSS